MEDNLPLINADTIRFDLKGHVLLVNNIIKLGNALDRINDEFSSIFITRWISGPLNYFCEKENILGLTQALFSPFENRIVHEPEENDLGKVNDFVAFPDINSIVNVLEDILKHSIESKAQAEKFLKKVNLSEEIIKLERKLRLENEEKLDKLFAEKKVIRPVIKEYTNEAFACYRTEVKRLGKAFIDIMDEFRRTNKSSEQEINERKASNNLDALIRFKDVFDKRFDVVNSRFPGIIEALKQQLNSGKAVTLTQAKKLKIDLNKSIFKYNGKALPTLRSQINELFIAMLSKVSDKTADTYVSLKDIVKACGWKIEDYEREPEKYKNSISGAISKINKALETAGLPLIGRLDSKKGYLCSIALKNIDVIPPSPSGKARPNINRLKNVLNTPPPTDE
ncbi:MAG: hypothetical protein AAB038_05200 [Planctomycetota bacterium]